MDIERGYKSYRLRGLPPAAFGETYVITTAQTHAENGGRCELFIVSARPAPSLTSRYIDIPPDTFPVEDQEIDTEYLHALAKQDAEIFLDDRLFEIAEEKERLQWLDCRYELELLTHMPLHQCWLRGVFCNETREIADKTTAPYLKSYLNSVIAQRPII